MDIRKIQNDLAKGYRGRFEEEHLTEIEQIEKLFHFSRFNSSDALKFGNTLIRCAEKYGGGIVIAITRSSDETVIFQYVGDSKSSRNLDFAKMKRNALMDTGHSSLWALAAMSLNREITLSENALPVGGAFPVYVNEEHIADIAVSGLSDGLDFILLKEAAEELTGAQNTVYSGPLI